MLTSQTRTLVLQAGRRSLAMWVRLARLSEPGIGADAQRVYERMAADVPWPREQANRVHLAFLVLPIAALYSVLRDRGLTEQEAVDAVTRGALTVGGPDRRLMRLLSRSGHGRRLFIRAMRQGKNPGGPFFPPPAWEANWVERSDDRIAFDITRCYDLEMFRLIDAAPAAVVCCATDDVVFTDLCPQLRWSRTGTLAAGADRCDFCWELLPTKTTHDRHPTA